MKTRMIAAALMLMTGSTAQADECDIMAAKIAKSMHLVVDPKRTQHHFIQMTSDGEYGAQLNCDQDHLGLNPSGRIRAGSVLPPTTDMRRLRQHVRLVP